MDNIGGAEYVDLVLARELDADIYTTNIDKEKIAKMGFSDVLPRISSIGKVPINAPLRQEAAYWKFRALNLDKKYDFYIIAGDWAMSAAVHNKPHLWYVYSPTREIWDLYEYTRNHTVPPILRPIFDIWVRMRRRINKADSEKIEKIISISRNVKRRVRKYLGRESQIIYPPIETSKYKFKKSGDYWLTVSRLIAHKRVDLQLKAFEKMPDKKLIIVGSYEKGARQFERYAKYCQKIKPKNVEIKNWVSQDELIELYANCRGFITTSKDEDFGMTPLEAMASGKPVIGPNEGGYKETIINNKTGILIDNINSEKIIEAVHEIENNLKKNKSYYKNACLKQAKKFDTKIFIQKTKWQIQRAISEQNFKKVGLPFGVNIFGYFDLDIGSSKVAIEFAKCAQKANIPCSILNISLNLDRQKNDSVKNFSNKAPYAINLFFTNPDGLPRTIKEYGHFIKGRYNIAYWFWELQEFPPMWIPFLDIFEEVWTASDFCASVIKKGAYKPVIKMTPPVGAENSSAHYPREELGLKKELFTFLFVYDNLSYNERKNPLAILQAYKRAFRKDEKVQLVIKATQDDDHIKLLRDYIKKNRLKNTKIITGLWDKTKLISLFNNCNCYISLHRAEGLGLTLMEAMLLGKPVITTAYSGNLDFTKKDNSFLVKYKTVKLKENLGSGIHYTKGTTWAEPNINDAAKKMLYVYENQKEADKIGERGREFVLQNYSPKKIGHDLKEALIERYKKIGIC